MRHEHWRENKILRVIFFYSWMLEASGVVAKDDWKGTEVRGSWKGASSISLSLYFLPSYSFAGSPDYRSGVVVHKLGTQSSIMLSFTHGSEHGPSYRSCNSVSCSLTF